MTLYAVHHDRIDGHAMQGPVGIWNEHHESHYPAITEHLKPRGHRASSRPKSRTWSGHLEYLTETASAYNANWSIVESDRSMVDVIEELQADFLAVPHPVKEIVVQGGPKEDSQAKEQDSSEQGEDWDPPRPEPAERFVIAQTWWIAAEFARRHPDWAIRYGDHMSYLTLVNPRNEDPDFVCNPTTVHMFGAGAEHRSVTDLLSTKDPHEVVKWLESFLDESKKSRAAPSTPRTLAYRLIAAVLAATVNDRSRWSIANEVLGDDEWNSGPIMGGFISGYPAAERALKTTKSEKWDDGQPGRHFWAILRDEKPVAIVSTEGILYRQGRWFDLADEYSTHGRRISPLLVAALGDLLP